MRSSLATCCTRFSKNPEGIRIRPRCRIQAALGKVQTADPLGVRGIVYLDGFHLKVRMAKRVISVPVLAKLGVAPDRQKRLLSLRLAVSEASTHWGSVLEGLQARGLRAPKLVISDGHKGLTKALEKWPGCRLQRCTEHKHANLLEHCPAHARRELRP